MYVLLEFETDLVKLNNLKAFQGQKGIRVRADDRWRAGFSTWKLDISDTFFDYVFQDFHLAIDGADLVTSLFLAKCDKFWFLSLQFDPSIKKSVLLNLQVNVKLIYHTASLNISGSI